MNSMIIKQEGNNMKNIKKIVASLLVMTMVLALATTAFAYNEEAYSKMVEFKKSAWGYAKVTNNHGVTKKVCLRKGSIAKVVAKKGDWYKIEVPAKKDGKFDVFWFNEKYTKNSSMTYPYIIFSSGGSGRSHQLSITKTPNSDLKGIKVKMTGKVNLRKGPCLEGKSKGIIKKNEKVRLTGRYGVDTRYVLFVEVKAKAGTGFISTEYLSEKDLNKIFAAFSYPE